jgi:hypothetical protein
MRATHRGHTTTLYAGVLISLMLMTAACNITSIKDENTLSRLEQMDINVQIEKIEDSLHKVIELKQGAC